MSKKLELEIKGTSYEFCFGMGFVRDINKRIRTKADNVAGADKNLGLQFAIASIIDGDTEELVNVLETANKTETPRVSKKLLDEYIDDDDTDIDQLFEDVKDFLSKTNACKTTMKNFLDMVEAETGKRP